MNLFKQFARQCLITIGVDELVPLKPGMSSSGSETEAFSTDGQVSPERKLRELLFSYKQVISLLIQGL